jgi:hypothetical protein
VSDKETAPRKSAAEFWGEFFGTGKEYADRKTCEFAEAYAAECTAQAPTQRWISVKDELPRPQQFVIAYYGEDDMEITWHTGEIWEPSEPDNPTHWQPLPLGPGEATPQGTPTDLLAVIERLANHGSVEDYTVEGIRAELREALHTFRPQGTPAPDEQAELAIYEQHIAELTARQKKPLSQQDRMWINGYRQGWLACLTRKRPTATPQGTPSECPQ